MKKIIYIALELLLCISIIACAQKPQSSIVPISGDMLYESYLTLLQNAKGVVSATCPASRALLNGNVVVTQEVLSGVSSAFTSYELVPETALRVPGNSQELELVFNGDSQLIVYIYNLQAEQKALVWIQASEQRLQLSADIALYNEIKAILDNSVVEIEPSYDGAFVAAQLLSGRDIARGFEESNGVIVAAHSSYDKKGYVDFYDTKSGELLNSLSLEGPIYRLDTGKNGEIRLFSNGVLCYIDTVNYDIKSEFMVPISNIDKGDSFDIDERLGLLAYARNGTIYISTLKGEDSLAVLSTADVERALPTEIKRRIEDEEGIVAFSSPRFLQDVVVATATTTIAAQPRVALSSFTLDKDIAKKLSDEEYVRMIEEEFTAIHFPNVFGTMGAFLGAHLSTAAISNDTGVTFSSMKTGEGWHVGTAWGERIVMLQNGYICTQTQELPQEGIRNRVDISHLSSYGDKTQVFASSATPLTVLGGTQGTLIMRDGTAQRLLFVNLLPFIVA